MSEPPVPPEPSEPWDWDYAPLAGTPPPEPAWAWRVDEYTDYSVCIAGGGLAYAVDDYSGLHGAGSQNFSQFLAAGPVVHGQGRDMPASLAATIRAYLLAHRRQGGARLKVYFTTHMQRFPYCDLHLELDDAGVPAAQFETSADGSGWRTRLLRHDPVYVHVRELDAGSGRRALLFAGPVSAGEEHRVRWALHFQTADGRLGESVFGTCRFVARSGRQHTLRLSLAGTEIAAHWGGKRVPTPDVW